MFGLIKKTSVELLVLCLGIICACGAGRKPTEASDQNNPGNANQQRQKPGGIEEDPNRNALVKGGNQFAIDLYGKLRKDQANKNLFFSPMSISTAMGMVEAGARGKTAEEIARTMHFTLPQSQLHPACRSLLEIIQSPGECELSIANRLWAQRGHKFLEDFLNITKQQYGAECGLVDFAGDSNGARLEINSWAAKHTRDRIRDLIRPGLLSTDTCLVLTNAIYFKGPWLKPFDARNTKLASFFTDDGEKQVEMMTMKDPLCRYTEIEEEGLQILQKPYHGRQDLSMTILLPRREPESLAKLEAALSQDKLTTWSKQLKTQAVKVSMPKFQMETYYSLKDQLSELGMPMAFTPKADFSGMDGTLELLLSFAVHKTFIAVDEKGTEAAAATAIGAKRGGKHPSSPPPEFRADHPFVFLISDNRTGSILFLGRFCDP
ncbi:MAG: serpin family protein [Pirellulales bacterium]|nr:serpin family protein [Pirellulales bacterium]